MVALLLFLNSNNNYYYYYRLLIIGSPCFDMVINLDFLAPSLYMLLLLVIPLEVLGGVVVVLWHHQFTINSRSANMIYHSSNSWHCAFILLICKTTSNMLAIQHLHLLKIKNVPCIDKIEHATATTKFPISLYVLIKKLHGMFVLFFIALFWWWYLNI